MTNIMKLGDIPDMERYLRNDCYCPDEIYDISGFSYQVFDVDSPCEVVEETGGMIAVVACKHETDKPQAVLFWRDDEERPGRIVEAQRVDATENNIGILRDIVLGKKPDGRKIDEFAPGSTAKALGEVVGMCDAVMVS